uniref:MADF domain-containing protein n=1 Tax=Oreochromis aureus TaxID=47969 RepID=A0AAZ1XST0_OREAU
LAAEKLISSVANRPELYDASCYFYRDRNKKDLAWRHISEEIGQPEDICRKKWESLRDTYNKEKRTWKEKRTFSILCFVLCFTGPQRRTAQKRSRDGYQDGPSVVELAILESLKRPRPSPTEYFLLGLAPALESLPPQTREFVKFQMHKLVFESSTAVLNFETLDPSDQ